jgi:hypothetical protein
MIDPTQVNLIYQQPIHVKEEYLLFCVSVAGKKAKVQAQKLHDFLYHTERNLFFLYGVDPFNIIRGMIMMGNLAENLKRVKLGQYNKLEETFTSIVNLAEHQSLLTWTVEDLEQIPGIGPKTARFFILHTNPHAHCAVLDTHILTWMREQGYHTPKSTPQGKKYRELEKIFLDECEQRGMMPQEFDLQLWKERTK